MKLISWNVNGLRACLKKGFTDFAANSGADIICLQEVRALPEQVELDVPGYSMLWNPALRKGYSGTAMLVRELPRAVFPGMGVPELDTEGRVMTAELEDIFLVTVYTPNAQRELARLPYRQKEWDPTFLKFVRKLEKKKPVVFCGDLNVSHKEIDLANPKSNRKNAGFTDEERAGFDKIVKAGFIDTFREFETGGGHYTWWSNRPGVRERNVGWRIDYFCISSVLRLRLVSASILADVFGSDHCPIAIELE
ncbi:exodeoxyribonuclease III [bacterium DOLJORAL78_65_58]|nr:MAG: exodeoxyribonuclease III [bacterium DOLZORAL124_64_63]PIE76248.1 MAG: exodeoxyribonuclease III [bacterium DOLJORAL78_65_58]